MVVGCSAQARRERILLKREQAKRENEERARQKAGVNKEEIEDNPSCNAGEEVKPESKKIKLEQSDGSKSSEVTNSNDDKTEGEPEKQLELDIPETSVIVANVFRYLSEEYKFLKLHNRNNIHLRPLAAIHQRTAEATGVTPRDVKNIVKADRERIRSNRGRVNRDESM